jgi:thiamine-monophosphate kinase
MNELSIVRLIRSLAQSRAPGVVAGIGDDCAILRPRPGEDLLLTTDFLIEDVHFRRGTHSGADCGWKALARGFSDIAAMGGTPRACLVSLALAPWTGAGWVRAFYRSLNQLAACHNAAVIGGDTSRAAKLACDIVVLGAVPRGRALRRDGAKPGDVICVTGSLGGSALGLASGKAPALRRHLRPEPRLEAGRLLRTRLRATSCIDVSDGLALDLHRLCLESKVAADLWGPLPSFPGASLEQALAGGEDYELLFTLPAQRRLPASVAGIPVTAIGAIRSGKPGELTFAGAPLTPRGWNPRFS